MKAYVEVVSLVKNDVIATSYVCDGEGDLD